MTIAAVTLYRGRPSSAGSRASSCAPRAARCCARSRAKPREDGARRLIIFLWTAWNMGGTIRAAFNLAEYMQARGWQVEIISGYRDRDEPFFGAFPAGVPVFDLDDRAQGGGLAPPAAAPRPERADARRRPAAIELQPVDRHPARAPPARPRRDPRRHAARA